MMEIKIEYNCLKADQKNALGLLFEVTAPETPADDTPKAREPKGIVFVIDRSGSMGGGRLELVKQTILDMIPRLESTDYLSVISFDDQARVELPYLQLKDVRMAELRKRIGEIHPGGSTNLEAGYLLGLHQVEKAAAKVGGIHANNVYPADFIYQNLMMQANVIEAAFQNGVKKLLFLGSSCIYPRMAQQPMREDALLTGPLEPTNEPYAIAKIAGIKLCESYNRQYGSEGVDYRSVMPTNLYGQNDNFDLNSSHVLPAVIRKFHEAKLSGANEVVAWGTGAPLREFLYVDDMAAASVFVMQLDKQTYDSQTDPMQSHINVGFGSDVTIAEVAKAVGRGDHRVLGAFGQQRALLDEHLDRGLSLAEVILDPADALVRQASFKGVREDKPPREVVRELPAAAAGEESTSPRTTLKTAAETQQLRTLTGLGPKVEDVQGVLDLPVVVISRGVQRPVGEASLLDPATDAARIRAFFVAPTAASALGR